MNKIILNGFLTKDPETQTTNTGLTVGRFTIAVKRRFEDKTDFFNCTAWRKLAETISTYCKKGSRVAVVGELHNDSYEAQDGSKRYATNIVVDEIEFLSTKNSGTNETPTQPELTPIEDMGDLPF